MALRVGPIADDTLVARALGEFGASLYASRGYLETHPPRTPPESLDGHRVIAYGSDLAQQPAAQWLEAHATKARVVMRSNEIATMIQAAESGMGVALLPCFMVDGQRALVRLTPRVLARRSISLVYAREMRQSPAARIVARFLVEAMRQRAPAIGGDPA